MPSGNVTAQTNYAGGQSPLDLLYIGRAPFGPTDDRKSTLNDAFGIISKNIIDGTVRFQGTFAPALSAASQGALYFNNTTNTFQASRNGATYENVLVGTGLNQQVAVFGSPVDSLNGFAQFTFIEDFRLRLSSNFVSGSYLELAYTGDATRPNIAYMHGGNATLGLKRFDANPPELLLMRGVAGPAFPPTSTTLGIIHFGVTNNATAFSGTTLARIVATTTEAADGSITGASLSFVTTSNGVAGSRSRLATTGTGTIIVGTTVTVGVPVDAVINVVLGNLTTPDANAVIQIGNAVTLPAPTTQKTLVVQANPSQTAAILEIQNSAGTPIFTVGPTGSITAGGASGSNKQVQFNNSGVFGGAANFEYDIAASWLVTITESNNAALLLKEATSTAPATIQGAPPLLHLNLLNGATFWGIGYSRDDVTPTWANFLTSQGALGFFTDDAAGGQMLFYPQGTQFIGTSATYFALVYESSSDHFSLGLTTSSPTSGNQNALTWSDHGVGINKATSIGAQLQVVSAAAARVAAKVDSAASPSVDILQITVNGSTTAGAYTGVMSGGTVFTPRNVVTGTGTQNLNFALGNIQQFTFGAGNATFTFSNIPNSALITIVIIQDGTGGRTLTWPATAKFIAGVAPVLSAGANARDIIQFYSDGTNIYQVSAIALAVA